MSAIARSIEFCASLDPAFTAAMQGSSAEDIAALEAAMAHPLSGIHREYLQTMGERAGTLAFGAYSTSPALLAAQRPRTLGRLPPDADLFAIPIGDADGDVFLVGEEPAVVRRFDGEDPARPAEEVMAASIAELLCLPMLNRVYTANQPLQASLIERERREDSLARCRRIAELFGFEPYWFSTSQALAARRGPLVLVAKQAAGTFLTVGLAGREELEWGVITRTFARELELKPFR
jgi:hypothetical protein